MLYFLFFPAEKAHDRQNLKEPVQNFGHYCLFHWIGEKLNY